MAGLRISSLVFVGAIAAGVTASAPTAGSAASLAFTSKHLTPVRTCVLSATPTTTTTVIDTEVRQQTSNTNYGTGTTMLVTSSGAVNRRVYLRFDLAACAPSIPAAATIREATLRLYITALPAACRTLEVFRVTATWTEGAITWGNQPFGTTLNNPATGSRVGAFDAGAPVGCQNRIAGAYIVGASVTADVASFVAGGTTNFGWMIRDATEGSGTAQSATFATKNAGLPAQVPQLVISYAVQP